MTEAEVERLKESMKEEQKRTAAALEWRGSRAAPMADVRGIFDEGHRDVQAKMKVKVSREVLQGTNPKHVYRAGIQFFGAVFNSHVGESAVSKCE